MAGNSRRAVIKRACAAIVISFIDELEEEKVFKKKKKFSRSWLKNRQKFSCYYSLLSDLKLEDCNSYRRWIRMDEDAFCFILERVRSKIQKQNTRMRTSIEPEERLALTLRFLATGETFASMFYTYQVSERGISKIVFETCAAIYDALHAEYLVMPKSAEEWLQVSKQFMKLWDYPNCIGALDGKHVQIQAPAKGGSRYYNYKGFHSIILMALVDADLCFLYIDVGANGRVSDGGVFQNCKLFQLMNSNSLNLPPPTPLPYRENPVPYVIVGDDAFPLLEHLMKPYPGTNLEVSSIVHNLRLSRARRCSENAFGIVSTRWRICRTTIQLTPSKVTLIISCICTLHNFLRRRACSRKVYAPTRAIDTVDRASGEILEGSWRTDAHTTWDNLQTCRSTISTLKTREIRNEYKEYFVSEKGALDWQWERTRYSK